ncbi:prepilin-type N-terminal cleavage/methylation domain-containing protein [Sulfurimonas sp. MAG313]|nr:prepilin-type N-terminal cleavage/methylation domain-containing protein [Sulfurimonas sp. MAG313]MDF1881904.1 prepilin-type N-terminal cleavage/methylation domain-containing protein [Sulfurimonas sp. MAG313]
MKKAFTLMELMLVVVIIGVVYAMALSSMKPPDIKELEAFSLMTLPKYLRNNYALSDAKIVCFSPCGKCGVLVDGQWLEDTIELFSSTDVRSYTLDTEGFANEAQFAPHDIEDAYRQACFILHKNTNGAIDPIVLENEEKFIYYKAAYEEPETFESLGLIQSLYQNELNTIRNSSDI